MCFVTASLKDHGRFALWHDLHWGLPAKDLVQGLFVRLCGDAFVEGLTACSTAAAVATRQVARVGDSHPVQ